MTNSAHESAFSRDEESELFSMLLAQDGMHIESGEKIPTCDRSRDIPASYGQQSLWIIDQMQPGSTAYHVPLVYRLRGPLQLEALAASLEALVERHEVLRTTLEMVGGEIYQRIAPYRHRGKRIVSARVGNEIAEDWSLPLVVDVQSLHTDKLEDEAFRQMTAEIRRPFDLRKGPLFRALVLRLGPEDHVLVLTMHHIIVDGTSLGILTQELGAIYDATIRQSRPKLRDLSHQYADYAHWQRSVWRTSGAFERQMKYWTEQLCAPRPEFSFAGLAQMNTGDDDRGHHISFLLDASLLAALESTSRRYGVTLYMTLLAAFQVLLLRFSGQEDILIGTPLANRSQSEFEGVVGYFVNTIVLRARLDECRTFAELLARTRDVVLGAQEHQELPLESLVAALGAARADDSPLFRVFFALSAMVADKFTLTGIEMSDVPFESGTAKFDLSLEFFRVDEGLQGIFEYRMALLEEEAVRRMMDAFKALLVFIVENAERSISRVSLPSEGERRQIVTDWNDTTWALNVLPIHRQFSRQTQKKPEAIALRFAEHTLTYAELDKRTNQLARALIARGVGPDVRVGVCMERSFEMVVALLGILKAGGAYVPLDPENPAERLEAMIREAAPRCIVAQRHCRDLFLAVETEIFCLDSDWHAIAAGYDSSAPSIAIEGSNLAYVIYTSGSTGVPKGAMNTHAGIANRLDWMQRTYPLTDDDRVLQKTPMSFDVSVWEFFWPLMFGAQLVLAAPGGHRDNVYLARLIEQQCITTLHFVPSMLRLFLNENRDLQGTTVKRVFVSGEALSSDVHDAVFQQFANAELHNLYGPTEAAVDVTFWQCRRERSTSSIPIGRPVANTQIHILDAELEPVPIGIVGEIYIGGIQLARGYQNRPSLTADRFVPAPFGTEPGSRLYRTGDLGRYRVDGEIEFLGRNDHQVKIRGVRIELGEIEAAIMQIPTVRDAVVVVRSVGTNDKVLVAYLVTTTPGPMPNHLRDILRRKLSEPMIPARYVFIDQVPLTTNGKRNLAALPPVEPIESSHGVGQWPNSPLQQTIATLWSEILGVAQVGPNDDFFGLGGHSLAAVQFLARLENVLHVRPPVRLLLAHSTVARFATALESFRCDKQNSDTPLPIAPAQPPKSAPLHIERRPLLNLVASGKLPPVDAVALSYLPDFLSWAFVDHGDMSLSDYIDEWYGDLPMLMQIQETPVGRIGDVVLPLDASMLFQNATKTLDLIMSAMHLAHQIGAKTISLTGLIPSATNYGLAIAEKLQHASCAFPSPTTGHSVTAAAMVLSMQRALRECGRDLTRECVGILGLGSIGTSTLRLMLRRLPHPREIILCDLYSKREALHGLAQELIHEYGFQGCLTMCESQGETPVDFYRSTWIIGATNVPDVLNVDALRSGTVVVDDSAPHCFPVKEALRRWQDKHDVVCIEGGALKSPTPIRRLSYVPSRAERQMTREQRALLTINDPSTIMGCVLSGALAAQDPTLRPSLGLVDVESSLAHYDRLCELAFAGAEFHLEEYSYQAADVEEFRKRFGHS